MNALEWTGRTLRLLDQRKLPREAVWEEYSDAEEVAAAIAAMKVRGAPAIAVAAAYGTVLAAMRLTSGEDVRGQLEQVLQTMEGTRPTAVNLFFATQRMREVVQNWDGASLSALQQALVDEAHRMAEEDLRINRAIGRYGADLFPQPARVTLLTHCNTGALATTGYGTALGVVRALHERGQVARIYVDETRPYLQGARLTAYELGQEGIPHTLITDNMAAYFMQQGAIDAVVVGADRIAANGDTANKIGTYGLAVLAAYHHVPFYVAAPVSTFDLGVATGLEIPIEHRGSEEVTHFHGLRVAPKGTPAVHPAFDVTPHDLITGIICERGVIRHPNAQRITAALSTEIAKTGAKAGGGLHENHS
ncbi:MAG: S-methyl-5-thioribose-1-phosphate isomerase [Alicyclobacillus shizuokensis]|nr:S-methyl-5-thioribose-1-phosphate isomerase [Alicyclobacillus shizuokensis]